jgi:hypothetical protein
MNAVLNDPRLLDVLESAAILLGSYLAARRVSYVRVLFFVRAAGMIFWVRDYTEQGLAQSEVHEEIERRFHDAGVALPSPVHRIVLAAGTIAPRRAQEV